MSERASKRAKEKNGPNIYKLNGQTHIYVHNTEADRKQLEIKRETNDTQIYGKGRKRYTEIVERTKQYSNGEMSMLDTVYVTYILQLDHMNFSALFI